MNTKTKILAIVEIAIVLCSVFLVAIPAIAAEQPTQEVSASTISTASKDDFVLGVYGNANEDDTIDMGDVVYTKLAIFGKKPKTELCDAKYDGRINVLDVIQTKLIILGKEKELTVIDARERIVTIKKPIKSTIATKVATIEMVRSAGAKDKLIAMVHYKTDRYPRYFGDFYHLPGIGSSDCESILNLNPDIVLLDASTSKDRCGDVLEVAGIHVYRTTGSAYTYQNNVKKFGYMNYLQEIKKLGYIFDTEEEAEEFSDWLCGFLYKIEDRVSELSDDEKQRLYLGGQKGTFGANVKGSATSYCCEFAGVKNIFDKGEKGIVDPEAIIKRDPEIIVIANNKVCNHEIDDPSEAKALREEIMNLPGFDHITAVKEDKVYIISFSLRPCYGGSPSHFFIGIAYYAKWFHPELFKDLDPQAIHQEYLDRFQRIDYDLDEWGVLVYPEPD